MKKSVQGIILLVTTVLISFILLTSCKDKEDKVQPDTDNLVNLLEEIEPNAVKDLDELPHSFLEANANFSFEFFKQIANEKNALYSAVPLYTSLALIANGSDSEAQTEILNALALDDYTLEDVNAYYHELVKELENESPNAQLNLSNSIWYDQDFEANLEFLETNKTYYEADSFKIDFSDSDSVLAMNKWVSEATEEQINEMIEEISPEAVMYLFSTIYFDGDWEQPFNASDSYESEFVTEEKKIEVEKMSGRLEIQTVETADEEGVILPYKGEQYAFLALMPKNGVSVREYLNQIDQKKITTLLSKIKEEEVDLLLPKFEVNFEKTLNDPLVEIGIQLIFDENANHLSEMGESAANLYVSEIFQKTYLTVDEEGTEAASAVGSEISVTSLPPEVRVVDFNRPFLYSIIDQKTGQLIFLGIMDDPKE